MTRTSDPLCLCGHSKGYHTGVSRYSASGHRVMRCCAGDWPKRKCRCPRFRLAIAQPSDRERVENTHPS